MILATAQIEKINDLLEQKEKEAREQRGMDADIRTSRPTCEKNETENQTEKRNSIRPLTFKLG